MSIKTTVLEAFEKHRGTAPVALVRAPGRVNLIGEHTDYNDGFVLPMAIDRAVWIALRPRDDSLVNVISLDFDDPIQFDLESFHRETDSPAEYMKGIARVLMDAGYALSGWDGVMKGDVPIGAGLSSSAALELATARAFARVSGFEWDAVQMAKLAQRAENQWVGVQSGIMDQMISAGGRAGYALLIDCRSLETQSAPLPDDTVIVVLDTGTRRGLVDSAYNERREQCEEAARIFGVTALRDVSVTDFEARAHDLDDITRRRAKHVITENRRTVQTFQAMHDQDAEAIGQLMIASHASLRDDFEVSSDALNAIVEAARQHPACYGARMTGAGFGGCAVALVRKAQADDFVMQVSQSYRETTVHEPALYICQATDGAALVSR